ncbi:Predicted nucleic acid-binding protein, contains PIN domain [Glycomyces sambucus]|uniref:Ribonuclease VapC n=1 Tax=Glycomyces sambucus TaxID=380244 RepID=A0A1G9JA18_9ACTN|nr:Predicted nucleic acid-binding protein, contains PIN domain [Glycomyces sambucus]
MTDDATLVVDSSALVELLIEPGERGEWVAKQVLGKRLFAPELLHYETANILRREERRGSIDSTAAAMAYRDLLDMDIHLEPFSVLANRVWEMRGSITAYDAAYVAVAEWRNAPLLTADDRLVGSNGGRCRFLGVPRF